MPSDAFIEVAPMDIWGESGDETYGGKTDYGMFEIFSMSFDTGHKDVDTSQGITVTDAGKKLKVNAPGMNKGGTGTANDPDTRRGEMTVEKGIDYASPDLFRYCCSKKLMKWAILYVREAGEENKNPWLIVELQNVNVSQFTWTLEPGGDAESANRAERVTFQFDTMLIRYYQQQATGTHKPMRTGSWNFADQNDKVGNVS